MGKVLVEILEKFSWVVLKCDYAITPKSNEQNYFYHLDNHKHPSKSHLWNNIRGYNRQLLYRINNHLYEGRFITEMDIQNNIESIFQSDCDVINHRLHQNYNFDIYGIKTNIIFQT